MNNYDPNNPYQPQQNPYQQQPQGNFNGGMQQQLPNATLIMILGILSIITACCCYGIVGLIMGIIALVMANKAKGLYATNPSLYTPSSYSNINVGRICAIIGIILGILLSIAYIAYISYFGWENISDPTKMQEMIEDMQRNM